MLIEVFDKDGKLLDSWKTDALNNKDAVVVIDNETPGKFPRYEKRTPWLGERKLPSYFARELDNVPFRREGW